MTLRPTGSTHPRSSTFPILLVIFGLVFSACKESPTEVQQDVLTSAVKADLQRLLDSVAIADEIPGAAIALKLADGEIWYTRVGMRRSVIPISNATPSDTMPIDAQFRIGSITKTFTATVILQLIDEGKFTLESSVSDVLPSLEMRYFDFDTITIRDLLQHTSGIRNYTDSEEWSLAYLQNNLRAWTPEELIVVADSLGIPPASAYAPYPWIYANTNYIILGLIIEEVTGQTAGDQIAARIIGPLGMTSTYFAVDAQVPDRVARGYSDFSCSDYVNAPAFPGQGEEFYDITVLNPTQGWTAGAIISTTEDMLRYVEALVDGDLVSEAMQEARLNNMVPAGKSGAEGFYGLGIARIEPGWIGHKGGFNGYDLSMYQKNGTASLIVLTNSGGTSCGVEGGAILFRVVTERLFNESPQV